MLIIFHKPKVPSIYLIKSLKSNTWEFLIWTVDYIYIYICRERERERERDVDGGGGDGGVWITNRGHHKECC